jgi:hypothetical protein
VGFEPLGISERRAFGPLLDRAIDAPVDDDLVRPAEAKAYSANSVSRSAQYAEPVIGREFARRVGAASRALR